MSAEEQSRSRLLRWLQNIVVVVIIGLLAMKLLELGIFSDRWGWQQAEREVLVKRFNENLMLARTEWLRRGKPGQVTLQTQQQSYQLEMNDSGWPSVKNGCEPLWQMLAGGRKPLATTSQPGRCDYELANSETESTVKLSYHAGQGRLQESLSD
ncbi:hypothetical protein DEU29_10894 [Idiomarina aquatica]|uniref:MSHA biogenesis protein MshF n=1 Tax=Idiomarina aquatica TaxID=1327752 RepID=A0A4R6P9D0_9GAMM|nr:Type II secretory pathway component [Idiomarina aquatica]TDP32749.1 hypothetical protein DEU29_10894 [Idiomarina aquatica]